MMGPKKLSAKDSGEKFEPMISTEVKHEITEKYPAIELMDKMLALKPQ